MKLALKNLVITTCFFLLSGFALQAQSINPEWVVNLGTTDNSVTTTDRQGNVFMAIVFRDTIIVEGKKFIAQDPEKEFSTNEGVLLFKYNANGKLEWVKQAGIWNIGEIHAIATDGLGNIYVAGGSYNGGPHLEDRLLTEIYEGESCGYLIKFNATGNLVWAKKAGNSNYDMVIDNSDNIYLTGQLEIKHGSKFKTVSPYKNTFYIARYNTDGNLVWLKQAKGSKKDHISFGKDLALDESGNIFVAGQYFYTEIYFDKTRLPKPDGINNLGLIGMLAKYTASGNLQWVRPTGKLHLDGGEALRIATDNEANVFGIGEMGEIIATEGDKMRSPSSGNHDPSGRYLIKYTSHGKMEWSQRFTHFDHTNNIAADAAGNVYTPYYDNDQLYLLGYNATGQLIVKQKIGENVRIKTIQADGNGNIYLTGSFTNRATLGITNLTGEETDKYYRVFAKFNVNLSGKPADQE